MSVISDKWNVESRIDCMKKAAELYEVNCLRCHCWKSNSLCSVIMDYTAPTDFCFQFVEYDGGNKNER